MTHTSVQRSWTECSGGGLAEYGCRGIGYCCARLPGGSRKSYDAFISYAHGGDEVFAPVVQRGLQHLAKPWNRRRAMEVFRDETSLAVSPGLWPSIRDALDASRWFVLLASPEAAGSQWVGEEITHWVSSKGTDYLLVVVTDGTWIWDDDIADVSPASTACNPELRGVFRTEPKYLDMTWARRNAGLTLRNARFRDQIATLAAAIREVPKEEIEGEDVRQQRRIRRIVRAVIAALTVLVVLASASAVVANVQRQQALYQRDVAISDELATNSEAIGETNATVSQLESIAAWGIHHSAQARYAMLSAAASPESSTFTVSSGAVFSVAFSPDGKMLATGDDHGTVLWDLATGRQIRSFSASFGAVNSVAFSPDGKMLATGDDHGTVLWDLATGRQIHSFPTGSAAVVSTAFTPDGKMLAIGLFSGTVQLRNVATGRQSCSFPGPDAIDSLALSPDSQMLVTGGLTARLWDLATGRQIRAFSAGSDVVGSVAFSPDGKILATGDADGTARLWNPDTGRQIGSSFTGVGAVESVAFSPDGKTLAIGGNDGTVLWNLGTGRQVSSFTSLGAVESVAFSPDGKTLATGDNDGTARVWDLARVPGDRGVQADLGLTEAEAVLAEFEIFFAGPAQPGCAARPGWRRRLAAGQVAVVKGELTGLEVAADQQVVPPGGGGQPRPGVPAVPFGSGPGRADLPAAPAGKPGGGLLAGQRDAAGHHQPEAARDTQYVGLVAVFAVLAQLGAGAVNIVAAHEIQPHATSERLGEDVGGQLALGAEHEVFWQAHGRRPGGIANVGGRIDSRAPISACPVPSRTYDRCTVLIPLATLPTQPRY